MQVFHLYRLDGKTAIIPGGERGLGAQIVECFAEAGANIVICSKNPEQCQKKSEELQNKYGVGTLALPCDISKQKDVKKVVGSTVKEFGNVDILVNNSGATWGAPAINVSYDEWEKQLKENITGTYLMSKEAEKVMIKRRKGKIINIISIIEIMEIKPEILETVGYHSSTGPIITFTKDLAMKLGKYNIHVNGIVPEYYPTRKSKSAINQKRDKILSKTPLNRMDSNEDLQGAALFLASSASDFVTGEFIKVRRNMMNRNMYDQ